MKNAAIWVIFVLLALSAHGGNTFSFTATANGESYSGAGYIGDDGKMYSTLQTFNVQGFGTVIGSSGVGLPVGINSPGSYSFHVGWGQYGDPWASITVYWDGSHAEFSARTLTIVLSVVNNVNRAQTVSLSGTSSSAQPLPANASGTLTFVVTGVPGTTVTLGCSPDSLIYDGAYDPITITASDSTIYRLAHVGIPKSIQHVHAVFINYSTFDVGMIPVLDGQSIGSVDAHGTTQIGMPRATSYDWNLELSPSSIFSFRAPSGHSASVQVTQSGTWTNYVVTIDANEAAAQTSVTPPASDGTVTATSTDPATGVTSISHSTPKDPTNASVDPRDVFSGTATASDGPGNVSATYSNTTPAAGSAAQQDSSNSLAAIERHTNDTAANTGALLKLFTPNKDYSAASDLETAQQRAAIAVGYGGPQPSGSAAVVVPTTGSSPELATWHIGDNAIHVSLVPTSEWRAADTLLRNCRSLLVFAALVAFAWSCSRVINEYVTALPQVGQAEANVGVENLIPGVSQGKTWGAAALIVGAIMVACGAIVVILNTWMSNAGYGITALFGGQNLGPLGIGLAYLDAYVPVAIIFQLGVLRAGFSFLVAPIYLGTASLMKFLKA